VSLPEYSLPKKEPVIFVEGKAGCVSLEAISVDPAVERYAQLGKLTEAHRIECLCGGCQAFLEQGDLVHSMGMQA